MRLALRQTGALARRSVMDTLRLPQAWFPALFFPMALLAIFTGSFGDAPGNVPGFPPVRGFLDFAVAGSVLQGVLIGGTTAGAAFATDIEGGFFDRLVASPVSRTAILTGRLAGGVVLGVVQTLLFLGIGVAFGAEVQGGPIGVLAIVVLSALLATAVGGLGVFLALRTGSAEAVQGTFPLFFVLLFFSSAFFPRETMTGWFREVADLNPISHLVEAMRDQVIADVDAASIATGVAIAGSLAALAVAASARALHRRLGGEMNHAARASLGLAWRSLILVRRMPSIFVPSLVMPLFILVATAGAFRGIAELPALEGVDYTAFTIPLATVMGAGFAGVNAGLTMARDIEGGFVDRLVASPAPRATLIAGPLVATAARSLITTTVVLVAGLLFGVGLPGLAGTLVVYVMALGFAGAAACWAMGIALRTRTVQSAPLINVIVFMSVFTSVAYAPREVLGGWLRTVADWNPVTRVLETSRAAELEAVTWDVLWPGLLAAGGMVAALGTFTALGLAGLGKR